MNPSAGATTSVGTPSVEQSMETYSVGNTRPFSIIPTGRMLFIEESFTGDIVSSTRPFPSPNPRLQRCAMSGELGAAPRGRAGTHVGLSIGRNETSVGFEISPHPQIASDEQMMSAKEFRIANIYGESAILDEGNLAGGLGFEPRFSESKSDVLPLDDPPTAANYTGWSPTQIERYGSRSMYSVRFPTNRIRSVTISRAFNLMLNDVPDAPQLPAALPSRSTL